jgi:hypothetical protein
MGMNVYTKKATSAAQFAAMRGVTDFTNAAQFNLYETGYSHLVIISKPEFLVQLAQKDDYVKTLLNTFCYILEYEFKGLSGIEDISVEELEVTDGISTMNVVGKITKQSASQVSMQFTEKSGSVITNFLQYYLEGIKDPRTQAKTYHGLIKNGVLAGGFENEVFNFLYMVTDNTMLQLEKAYLLCNAFPEKASTSIYESEKGSIDKKDIDVTFHCFVLDGPQVEKRARDILSYINETDAVYNAYNTHDGVAISKTGTIGTDTVRGEQFDRVVHLSSAPTYDGDTTDGYVYTATKDKSDLATYTTDANGSSAI